MWLALQLSHNDVLGVGLGWVLGLGGPESLPRSIRNIPLGIAAHKLSCFPSDLNLLISTLARFDRLLNLGMVVGIGIVRP